MWLLLLSALTLAAPLTPGTGPEENPRILQHAGQTALVWREDSGRRLVMQPLGPDGQLQGAPVVLLQATGATDVLTEDRYAVAVAGDRLLVAYQGLGVFVRLFDHDGSPLTGWRPVDTDTQRGFPTLATDGTDFLLVTTTQRATRTGSDLVAYPITARGDIGSARRLTDSRKAFTPELAFGHGRYLLTWRDDRSGVAEVMGQLLTTAGAAEGPSRVLSAPAAFPQDATHGQDEPELAVTPRGFALVWQSYRGFTPSRPDRPVFGTPHVMARQLTAEGTPVGAPVWLPSHTLDAASDPPDAIVSDDTLLVTWNHQDPPHRVVMSSVRLSSWPDGPRGPTAVAFTDGEVPAGHPQVGVDPAGHPWVVFEENTGPGLYRLILIAPRILGSR